MKHKYWINLFLSVTLVLSSFLSPYYLVTSVKAVDNPQSPQAPSQPDNPDLPQAPSQPDSPSHPDSPSQPSQSEHDQTPKEPKNEESENQQSSSENNQDSSSNTNQDNLNSESPNTTTSTGNETESGGMGNTSITSGDGTTTGNINNQVNSNLALTNDTSSNGSSSVSNTGNGSNTDNDASVSNLNDSLINQENDAVVTNTILLSTDTGGNTVKDNTGGDTNITTGDANTSLTLVNQINTNMAGVDVVEFNVVDDHVGDLILDFTNPCSDGSCVAGNPVNLINSSNGTDSENTIDSTTDETSLTFQNNEAEVNNLIVLESDSGHNHDRDNTGGDNTITTGDANVAANVTNFVNNNIAGNVIYGVVNIYGDLTGDIVAGDFATANSDTAYLYENSGNGSNSENTINNSNTYTDTYSQNNNADINNDLAINATSGNNSAKDNTGGSNSVTTGDANVLAQVMNIANVNVINGNWWLVLVNEAGNWIGKIIGGEGGTNYAGTTGTEFIVANDGTITASNNGNGSDSINNISDTNTNTNTITQDNKAIINNTLDLSANTGGNYVKDNTGGNNSITTGNANVVANIVNFVNNNIIGNGKLYVTVVNVFGNWLGDFVSPGYQKETSSISSVNPPSEGSESSNPTLAIGGTDIQVNNDNLNSNDDLSKDEETGVENQSYADDETSDLTYFLGNNNDNPYNGTGLTESLTDSEGSVVFGAQDELLINTNNNQKTTVAGKKIIHLNLAWLLLLIPCVIVFTIRKVRNSQILVKPTASLSI